MYVGTYHTFVLSDTIIGLAESYDRVLALHSILLCQLLVLQ